MARNYDVENRSESSWIFLRGTIDEDADFPEWSLIQQQTKIALDLGQLQSMNSSGIREWMLWTQKQPAEVKVVDLYNVPAFFLDQVTMVKGFLPVDFRIHSFRLRYYCEATQETKEKLFEEDSELKFTIPENVKVATPAGDKTFEVDHMLSKTLRTLETRCRIENFHQGPFFD
ncbi:MAG: hypothetical protein KF681_17585 [Bdellovibrionaceae bacterium]|nr:hypothetical protein [Pseudobdellovibrionaceae bacterium]